MGRHQETDRAAGPGWGRVRGAGQQWGARHGTGRRRTILVGENAKVSSCCVSFTAHFQSSKLVNAKHPALPLEASITIWATSAPIWRCGLGDNRRSFELVGLPGQCLQQRMRARRGMAIPAWAKRRRRAGPQRGRPPSLRSGAII